MHKTASDINRDKSQKWATMPNNQSLRSKLFFLDTETYMARNFQFDSGVLETLQAHLEEDDCHLLITDINVREIQNHLKRKASEAYAVIRKAQKDAMILRNTTNLAWHGIFERITKEQIHNELEGKFQAFLKNDAVEIVSTNTVNIKAIFDAYFEEAPPFATSGKKSEFPDAFILHAIDGISKQRGHLLYVVSADRDVKSFCAERDNLLSITRLEELLELVLKNTTRLAEPAKFAEEIFSENKDSLLQKIKEQLEWEEFEISYDEYGNPFEAEITNSEIESIDYLTRNLTEVSKESASFEMIVKVSVILSISYPDYGRSPWDSEDKAYALVLHNEIVQRYTTSAPVIVSFEFFDGIAANAEISQVDVNALTDLTGSKIEQISFKEASLSDDDYPTTAE
jgi:hypothetical protein